MIQQAVSHAFLHVGTFFAVYITPFFLTLFYFIRRSLRRQAEAERLALPFDPKPIPAPTGLFRGLSAPQRVYLSEQLKLFLIFYIILGWTLTFIFSLQFLNSIGNPQLWTNPAARTWFLFLRGASNTDSFFTLFLIACAFTVIGPLRVGSLAMFHRTRPLSLSFLFWTRTLAVVLALVLGTLTAIGLAFALLVAVRGPVWHNLPATIPRAIGPDDADLVREYANLLVTSPPRIFLSFLTTLTLGFSVLLAFFCIPLRFLSVRVGAPIVLIVVAFLIAILSPIFLLTTNLAGSLHPPRILFLYSELGPPPPYLYALGPIVLSAALLLLARIFVRRIEL